MGKKSDGLVTDIFKIEFSPVGEKLRSVKANSHVDVWEFIILEQLFFYSIFPLNWHPESNPTESTRKLLPDALPIDLPSATDSFAWDKPSCAVSCITEARKRSHHIKLQSRSHGQRTRNPLCLCWQCCYMQKRCSDDHDWLIFYSHCYSYYYRGKMSTRSAPDRLQSLSEMKTSRGPRV